MQSTEKPINTDKGILIFDSGVGAISVFSEINRLLPQLPCSLAVDNACFPYGTLSEEHLLERVVSVLGKLIELSQPQLAVIACNTASTLVLEQLRSIYDIPFVGVVPAIKPAAKVTKSGSIGLLATPATIDRGYTDNLIEDFAPECTVVRVGSTELVHMAENKLRGQHVDMAQLTELLKPFIENTDLDTLVLACTHFPLLAEEISIVLTEKIKLLDSGTAIAKRVRSLLKIAPSDQTDASHQKNQLLMTKADEDFEQLEHVYKSLGIGSTEVFEL